MCLLLAQCVVVSVLSSTAKPLSSAVADFIAYCMHVVSWASHTERIYTRCSALKAIKVIYQRITMMKLMRCVVAKVVPSGYCRWRLFLLYSAIYYTHCQCHTHFLVFFSSSSSFIYLRFFSHSSAFSRMVGDSPVVEKWFQMCKRVWMCVCVS